MCGTTSVSEEDSVFCFTVTYFCNSNDGVTEELTDITTTIVDKLICCSVM